MAAPKYANQPQSARSSQAPFSLPVPSTLSFDPDTTKSSANSFSSSHPVSVLIRGIPGPATREQVSLIVVWSDDLAGIEVLPELEDNLCSAIVTFKTPAGAKEAKNFLDGKQNMSVEVLGHAIPKGYGAESTSSTSASATSSGPTSRQPSRYTGAFPAVGKVSPPMNGSYSGNELPNPDENSRYQALFSPQSPIGSHLTERTRISGKSLINDDAADDDETGELLKDPVAYAENGAATSQRRATAPHLPISQLAGLSLNTSTAPGPSSLPQYGHQGMLAGHHSAMSPNGMNGNGHSMPYSMGSPFGRPSFPPVNPADQNPPCNTLYVGNLPIDTSEEELKAMFSKQRGYKRLCFRTKQNGPMCFVEFEDVTFATKALNELYGHPLHNSVKGGIRLSFSKNPLGVRSGQTTSQASAPSMTSMMAGSPNGFSSANGPPPGLSAPPGLGQGRFGGSYSNGQSYTPAGFSSNGSPFSNPWASYPGPMASGGPNPPMGNGKSANFMAPHMLGR